MYNFTIYNENGWPLTIHYQVHGRFMPATRTDPEENAEIEIIKIILFGTHDITQDVDDGDMDWLQDEAEGDFQQQVEDAEAEKADYEYERFRDEQLVELK